MKVLIIDNYDSFVYNIAQYIGWLGAKPIVYRNDVITLKKALKIKPDRIIISPGPGTPESPRYFGVCPQLIRRMSPKVPTLGVCLGHQGIAYCFGGRIVRAGKIMHGKTSLVKHDGKGVFKGVKNPVLVTRYHSLVVDKERFPSCLAPTAFSLDDGEIMGLRHEQYPIEGVQFHPESVMTEEGLRMLKNFLDEW